MDNNGNGGQGDNPQGGNLNTAPANNAPVDNGQVDGGVTNDQSQQNAQVSQSQPTPQTQPAPQVQSQSEPQSQPQPIVSNPQPISSTSMAQGTPVALANQKKSHGVLIAVIVTVAVVLVAAIVAVVVVLMNNNSSKSQTGNKDKGNNSHYEEDDDKNSEDDDDAYGGWDDDDDYGGGGSSDVVGARISCLGFQFDMQSGYTYNCNSSGDLTVYNSTFGMYVELISAMSYYQAEGHMAELASQFSSSGATINSYRQYTASNGRKMIVYDAVREGLHMYLVLTAASSSSMLGVQVFDNGGGEPTTSLLETAAKLLNASTVASKLPENESGDSSLPTIDWNFAVPEL